jgi:cytochrome c
MFTMPAYHPQHLRIAVSFLLVIPPISAHAVDVTKAQAIAQQHACLSCHAVDHKVVGPAYKDVAAKYASDPKARDYLVTKITGGSQGVWGTVAMPPNAGLTSDDVNVLVDWILAGAPPS